MSNQRTSSERGINPWTCPKCEYFKAHERYSECRRKSPVGYGYRDSEGEWRQRWGWPLVNEDDWCGEWKPAETWE